MSKLKRVDCIGDFVAFSEDSDKSYLLFVYVEILDAGTMDNPDQEIEGLHYIKTDSGLDVNILKNNKFKIIAIGEILYLKDDIIEFEGDWWKK